MKTDNKKYVELIEVTSKSSHLHTLRKSSLGYWRWFKFQPKLSQPTARLPENPTTPHTLILDAATNIIHIQGTTSTHSHPCWRMTNIHYYVNIFCAWLDSPMYMLRFNGAHKLAPLVLATHTFMSRLCKAPFFLFFHFSATSSLRQCTVHNQQLHFLTLITVVSHLKPHGTF